MKKLLIISSFVTLPLLSGVAIAECQHGGYAMQEHDAQESLIASELDAEALELLRKRLEAKKAMEEAAPISYL